MNFGLITRNPVCTHVYVRETGEEGGEGGGGGGGFLPSR